MKFSGYLAASVCALALLFGNEASAQAERVVSFNITSNDLGGALNQFAQQSDRQIVFSNDVTSVRHAKAVHGNYRPNEALDMLLKGTGLSYKVGQDNTIVVSASTAAAPAKAAAPEADAPRPIKAAAVMQSTDAAPTSRTERTPEGIDEIIVTARKRNESFLSVPVIASVLTATTLEKNAVHDLYTVANRVPGFVIGNSLAANGVQVSMRGIGNTANNATIDQSVSLNLDGLQLTQGLAYSIGMFDVGQIEVLKGPQALFFGKNSPAGVVSLRSADPTDKFEIIARAGFEVEAREKTGEIIASGPVSNSLKLRLAAKYSHQLGFFLNDGVAIPGRGARNPLFRRVAPTKDLILRGTALFDPNDVYSARLKVNYEYMNIKGVSPALQVGYCPDGVGGVPPLNVPFLGNDACKIDRHITTAWLDPTAFAGARNNAEPFFTLKQMLGSLEQNFKFGNNLTLTSLTGLYGLKQEYIFVAASGNAPGLASDSGFRSDQLTQELRLASSYDGPINFMGGGFYQYGRMKARVFLLGNTAFGLPATLQRVNHKIDINSGSLFAQATWKITPELEFAPGVRWTKEKRTDLQINYNPGSGPLGVSPVPDPVVQSSNWSPEVTLTYKPTSDLTVFAAYKTGFKSGSFNGIVYSSRTTPISFKDEKVKGGEVGMKSRFMDRQLSVNLAGYYYKYSNLQVGANEINGATGALILRTLNAASAKVYGIDFDASYSPQSVQGLTLNTAINYNHARYISFPNAPCGNGQTIPQGCNKLANAAGRFTSQDLSGQKLVRAPEWSGTFGMDYEMPVSDNLTLDFATSANFSSTYLTNLIVQPGFYQKGYIKANASVALKSSSWWEVALIGNNINNKIISSNCSNSNAQNGTLFGGQVQGAALPGPAGGDEANCIAERGREVWIRVTTKF
jgi:outer membrane receptor protein involved in Fe transport